MPTSKQERMSIRMSPTQDDDRDENMMTTYRSNVSSIMYAAVHSRPGVTFAANLAARYMSNPGKGHATSVVRIFQYLSNTMHKSIEYKQPTDVSEQNQLVCYVDSSHADSDDLRTTVGYIIYLNGGPISWRTLLHKGHCGSPTESEYMAMYYAVTEVLSLRHLMDEIGYGQNAPTKVHEDNEGSIKVANNPRCHERLKHIDLKHHIIRDAIESKDIEVMHVQTANQDADILTKPLPKKEHWRHADKMLR
jgi:hypothetical protein